MGTLEARVISVLGSFLPPQLHCLCGELCTVSFTMERTEKGLNVQSANLQTTINFHIHD